MLANAAPQHGVDLVRAAPRPVHPEAQGQFDGRLDVASFQGGRLVLVKALHLG